MREILFRGKRLDNGDWAEGYYVRLYGSNGKVSRRIYPGCAEVDCGDYYPDYFEVIPTTVSQYTGLKDKNGKRIFEGDIVKFNRTNALGYINNRVGEVKYYDELPVFYILATTGDAWDWCDCFNIDVVGNIHDNPELLKEGK